MAAYSGICDKFGPDFSLRTKFRMNIECLFLSCFKALGINIQNL